MNPNWLLLPVLANFFLTFVVQGIMYRTRIGYIIRNKISPSRIATRTQLDGLLAEVAPASDNFKNQFELPVIFYSAIAFFMITGWASWLDFYLASGFVIMRILHATIHVTNNRVRHRFNCYVVSTFLLWGLVVSLLIRWIQHVL